MLALSSHRLRTTPTELVRPPLCNSGRRVGQRDGRMSTSTHSGPPCGLISSNAAECIARLRREHECRSHRYETLVHLKEVDTRRSLSE